MEVERRERFKTWIRYSGGAEGEVNLSHLACGSVIEARNDRSCLKAVHIPECDAIAWGDQIELCPDALYMRLTGESLAEGMPASRPVLEYA